MTSWKSRHKHYICEPWNNFWYPTNMYLMKLSDIYYFLSSKIWRWNRDRRPSQKLRCVHLTDHSAACWLMKYLVVGSLKVGCLIWGRSWTRHQLYSSLLSNITMASSLWKIIYYVVIAVLFLMWLSWHFSHEVFLSVTTLHLHQFYSVRSVKLLFLT